MIWSILAVLCVTLYTLRYLLQWWRYRRSGGEAPPLPRVSLRDLPNVVPVAILMVAESALYRYAYQFALGLELNILRVISLLLLLIEGHFTFHVSHLHIRHHHRISCIFYPSWTVCGVYSALHLVAGVTVSYECCVPPQFSHHLNNHPDTLRSLRNNNSRLPAANFTRISHLDTV
jgi:hypothetical protein